MNHLLCLFGVLAIAAAVNAGMCVQKKDGADCWDSSMCQMMRGMAPEESCMTWQEAKQAALADGRRMGITENDATVTWTQKIGTSEVWQDNDCRELGGTSIYSSSDKPGVCVVNKPPGGPAVGTSISFRVCNMPDCHPPASQTTASYATPAY